MFFFLNTKLCLFSLETSGHILSIQYFLGNNYVGFELEELISFPVKYYKSLFYSTFRKSLYIRIKDLLYTATSPLGPILSLLSCITEF